jgi:Rhodopirellula transposase DDE domain
MTKGRIRKEGGGRKLKEDENPKLLERINEVIKDHTAGCPVEGQKWTYLTAKEIMVLLSEKGIEVCQKVIKRLLKKIGIGRRKLSKDVMMKNPENRNEQFEIIKTYKEHYLSRGYAVLSIDTKKKELLGPYYRAGELYSERPVKCYDHDFPSFSLGKIVPYGIYDVGRNEGYITIGQSADTAEFSVSCLKKYWKEHGSNNYDKNEPMLILADGGGSNGSQNRLFKLELQDWADEEGLKIRICHYPPYCSKYNPIEHRLFPAITNALKGVMLDSVDTVINLIKTRTKIATSLLNVFVNQTNEVFEKGTEILDNYLDYCNVQFDKTLGKWNYRILPTKAKPDSY